MSVQRRPAEGDPPPGKSLVWVVRYRGPDGRERSESFTKFRAANVRNAEITRDLARGTWVDPAAAAVPVLDYAARWAGRSGRESTRRNRRHLLDNLGDLAPMPLTMVRPSDVDSWAHCLGTGRGWASGRSLRMSTVRVLAGQLRGVFAAAVTEGLLVRNPVTTSVARASAQVAEVDKRQVPTLDQVQALASVSPSWFVDALELAATTGLRAGEVAGLTGADLAGGEIRVHRQCPHRVGELTEVKSRAARRRVPLPASLAARWDGIGDGERLISGSGGFGTTTRGIVAAMADARNTAGIPAVTFHGLRHLYASTQLAAGVPLPMVSALLGHGDVSVTARVYAHWLPGQQELAAAAGESLAGNLVGTT